MKQATKIAPAKQPRRKFFSVAYALLALILLSYVLSKAVIVFTGQQEIPSSDSAAAVAVIDVSGIIANAAEPMLLGRGVASADEIVSLIKRAESDPRIRGIALRINSPGGTPVASEMVAKAVQNLSKPTASLILDQGTSGAYWVAASSDRVISSRLSLVGSVGVQGSFLVFSGLMDKYGVYYNRLVAGKFKDIGTPFRNMTSEEKKLFSEQLEEMHRVFLGDVAKLRNLDEKNKQSIATGMVFVGERAKELGLVDEFGGERELENYFKKKLNASSVTLVSFRAPKSLLSLLGQFSSSLSYYLGFGIGHALLSSPQSISGFRAFT